MLTYEKLIRKPRAFRSMTGPNIEEFDAFVAGILPLLHN